MEQDEFDHIPSEGELRDYLAETEADDPASRYYKRKLSYPTIKWKSVIINVLAFLLVLAFLTVGIRFISKNVLLTVFCSLGMAALYCLIRAKSIFIFLVECYQLLAPTKLRMKCRFEPSCSDYMILSLRKYGAWKGLFRGLKRIRRCRYPNGGYDYP